MGDNIIKLFKRYPLTFCLIIFPIIRHFSYPLLYLPYTNKLFEFFGKFLELGQSDDTSFLLIIQIKYFSEAFLGCEIPEHSIKHFLKFSQCYLLFIFQELDEQLKHNIPFLINPQFLQNLNQLVGGYGTSFFLVQCDEEVLKLLFLDLVEGRQLLVLDCCEGLGFANFFLEPTHYYYKQTSTSIDSVINLIYRPWYLKSIINWQLNSQNSKSMQYKQGSMHSITHPPSEHQTPNRNHPSNSFYAHSNNYSRYPNPNCEPHHNNDAEKIHWDQRSELSYHHKNQGYFEKQNTTSRQVSSVANQITKVVPMKVINTGREDYTHLRVSIFHSERVGPNNPANITINVTDDSNALFLWRFYIPQNDFQNFKEQQSLKVDFGGFIGMILETLGYCEDVEKDIQSGGSNNFHTQNHPNFFAVFNIDKNKQKAELKIMQANKFKESLHMLLHFIKANDEQLKEYLSEKYHKEKNQNLKLNQYISEIENQLNRRKLNEEKLGSQLKNLERESSENRYQLEKALKQRFQSFERKADDKFHKEKTQYLEEHTKIVQDLKLKLEQKKQQYEQLLRSHQNANQKTLSLQSTSSSLQNQHILLQTKYDQLRQEHAHYRSEHEKLNKEHLQLVSKNTKNQYQLASLEEKNEQKNKQIGNLKKMQEQIQEQLQYAQGQLKDNRAEIETLRKSLESKGEEIEILEQKIEEWKGKYQKKKKKNNAYMQVIEKQQSQIEKHEIDIRKLNSEITLINEHKERLERLVKDKERSVTQLQQQIENDKEQIQNQKNMIMQMHKQVNSGRFGATSSLSPSPMVGNNFMTTSSASIKDYSAYTGSESRIKFTGGNIRETSPIGQKSDRQRMAPPLIKKYREPTGIQNEKNRENSRSPMVNKLSQQMDPQQADKTQQKIGPIKFRK